MALKNIVIISFIVNDRKFLRRDAFKMCSFIYSNALIVSKLILVLLSTFIYFYLFLAYFFNYKSYGMNRIPVS